MNFINAFFCSLSNFFFNNIFTFILFITIGVLLYLFIIKRLNNFAKNLYIIFFLMIFAGGIVLVLLPNKENMMDPIVVNSFYFSPFELTILLALIISILLSKYASIQTKKILDSKKEVKNINIDNKQKIVDKKEEEKKPVKKEVEKKKSSAKKTTTKKTTKKKTDKNTTKTTTKTKTNKKTNTNKG